MRGLGGGAREGPWIRRSAAASTWYARTGRPNDLKRARLELEQALAHLSSDSPSRAALVITLAVALRSRAMANRDPSGLREAAAQLRDFEPAHPHVLANLSVILVDLYDLTGDRAPLGQAIDACAEAVRLATDPMSRVFAEMVLGQALVTRYRAAGDFGDLDRGITLLAGAAESGQLEAEYALAARVALANALALRYTADQRRRQDLDEAIALDTETVRLLPSNSPEMAKVLQNLGTGLGDRWLVARDPHDLEQAETVFERGMKIASVDPDMRRHLVGGAGRVAVSRFMEGHEPADLRKAITLLEEAAEQRTEEASPHHYNLALALGERYMLAHDRADLTRAVTMLRDELDRVDPHDPRRPTHLGDLAGWLLESYQLTANTADLESAIAALDDALSGLPRDSPRRGAIVSNLGIALMLRYTAAGETDDLQRAVAMIHEAIAAPMSRPDEVLRRRANLAAAIALHSAQTGEETDFEEAIRIWTMALAHATPGPLERVGWLRSLASALAGRHARTGEIADIEGAVSAAREAIEVSDQAPGERAMALSQLSVSLADRYGRSHDVSDLEETLSAAAESIESTGAGSVQRAGLQHNLSRALGLQYELTRGLHVLQHAASAAREAVKATPKGTYGRATFLGGLGFRLIELHRRSPDAGYLDEAIAVLEEGLEEPAAFWFDQAGLLHILGIAFRERYRATGRIIDLDAAIAAFERSVEATPPESSRRGDMLAAAAFAIDERYAISGELGDLQRAIAGLEGLWTHVIDTFVATPVAYKLAHQAEWAHVGPVLVDRYLALAERAPNEADEALRRALLVVEARKSRILAEAMSRGEIPSPRGVDAGLLARERDLLGQLSSIDAVALAQTGQPLSPRGEKDRAARSDRRAALLRDLEQVWDSIASVSAEAAGYISLRRASPPTWEELASLAERSGASAVIISMHVSSKKTVGFALSAAAEAPTFAQVEISSSWEDILERLFHEVHAYDGTGRRGETWYRALLPLVREIRVLAGNATRIILAPDGDAHLIPWSVVIHRAGWTADDGGIVKLSEIPALALLRTIPRGRKSESPALVAGDPLGDLACARDEALAVAELLATEALVGPTATRETIHSRLAEPALFT